MNRSTIHTYHYPFLSLLTPQFHAQGIAMDAVSYNAILTACAQGGNWVGARRLIEGLAAKGVLKVLYGFYSFRVS